MLVPGNLCAQQSSPAHALLAQQTPDKTHLHRHQTRAHLYRHASRQRTPALLGRALQLGALHQQSWLRESRMGGSTRRGGSCRAARV